MSQPLPATDPSNDPTPGNLIDGRPGEDPADQGAGDQSAGDQGAGDTTLTTDDAAQDDDGVVQPGNS